jgi:hypothetical protein
MLKPKDIWNAALDAIGVIKQPNATIPAMPDNLFDQDIAATQARRLGRSRVIIPSNSDSLR